MFKTDSELSREGIWLDFGGFEIKVAATDRDNPKYASMLRRKMKPHQRAIDSDSLANEVAEDILVEVYANTVVKDWKCVTDESGEALPCTIENVIKLLKELPRLFSAIQDESAKLQNYRREDLDETIKN